MTTVSTIQVSSTIQYCYLSHSLSRWITGGRYCETCVIGFYCQTGVSQTAEDACVACQCNSAGSESVDCAKV